jgi:hypothetical protein
MDLIVNPETGRRVSIYGKTGRRVLSNYIRHFGGSPGTDPHEQDMGDPHKLDIEGYHEPDVLEHDPCRDFTDIADCPDWCEISNIGAGEAYCRSPSPSAVHPRAAHPTIMGSSPDPRWRGRGKTSTQRKATKGAVGLMALASIPVVSAHGRQYTNGTKDGKLDAKTGKKDKERYQNDTEYQKAHDKQKAKELDDDK